MIAVAALIEASAASEPFELCERLAIACATAGHAIATSTAILAIDLATSHHTGAPNERLSPSSR